MRSISSSDRCLDTWAGTSSPSSSERIAAFRVPDIATWTAISAPILGHPRPHEEGDGLRFLAGERADAPRQRRQFLRAGRVGDFGVQLGFDFLLQVLHG